MNTKWQGRRVAVAGSFRHIFCSLGRRASQCRPVCALGFAVSGLLAALCLFFVCFWLRLQFGPVSLGPSVSMVSGALADALPDGISVSYGRAALEWSREDSRVHLVILDIRMAESDGKTIVSAPKAEIDLAGPPLLKGIAEVHRIALVGVKVTLVRTAEGTLRFGIGKNRVEQDVIDQFVRKLSAAKGGSSLKTLAVRGAQLVFYDETSDIYVTSDDASLHLARSTRGNDMQVVLNTRLNVAGRPANMHLVAGFSPNSSQSNGTLDVQGLDLAAILSHRAHPLVRRDSQLKTRILAAFSLRNGRLSHLQFTVSGAGRLFVPALKQDFPVKTLSVRGGYDGASGRLTIADARLDAAGASGDLHGWVLRPVNLPDASRAVHAVFPDKADANKKISSAGMSSETSQSRNKNPSAEAAAVPEKTVRASFTLRNLSLNVPHLFADPVHFPAIGLNAEWDDAARQLTVSRIYIHGAPLSLEATGALHFTGKGSPGVDLTGSLGMLDVRSFVKFWPVMIAPGGRAWVDANMSKGEAGPFSFDVHYKPGELAAPVPPRDAVDVRFLMTNMESSYISGMPHLTGIHGRGHLTATDFTVDVDHASDGPMELTNGQFHIPDMNTKSQTGDIRFTLSGAVPDLMTLLDSPPLGYPSRFGIRPNSTRGHVVADSSISVPLVHNVTVSAIRISVHAETTGLGLRLAKRLNFTDGKVVFDVDNDKLHAAGPVGLGGSASRLNLDWSELFTAPKKQLTTHLKVSGTLDDTALRSLDIVPAGSLKGTVRVTGMFEGMRGAMADGQLSLDLTPAAVQYTPLNITKAAGQALGADVTLGFGAKSALSQVRIVLSGGRGRGHAVLGFSPDGALQQVDMPDFRYGRDNQFSLEMQLRKNLSIISLKGQTIDLSRFLSSEIDAKPGQTPAAKAAQQHSYQLYARLDRVVLRDGVKLSDLKLRYETHGPRISAFSLDGSLGNKAALRGVLTPSAKGRTLKLTSDDAGLLFGGVYGFSSMRGGSFEADADLSGPAVLPPNAGAETDTAPDFTGKLEIRNFRLVNQPLLTRLFTAGSLGGMANLMGGKGIAVDDFHAHFSSRHHVISVFDTRAVGPAVGATAEGYVDLGKDVVALKGTLVPLYGLNSVLGNIPILGLVLTSKKGEGIFGVSYEISGNTSEPDVSVNPLSMLAPGFLRRIFEGRIPSASDAPSNNPLSKPKTKAPSGPKKAAAVRQTPEAPDSSARTKKNSNSAAGAAASVP